MIAFDPSHLWRIITPFIDEGGRLQENYLVLCLMETEMEIEKQLFL